MNSDVAGVGGDDEFGSITQLRAILVVASRGAAMDRMLSDASRIDDYIDIEGLVGCEFAPLEVRSV